MAHDFDPIDDHLGFEYLLRKLRACESAEEAMQAVAKWTLRLTRSAHASVRIVDAPRRRLLYSACAGLELRGRTTSRSSLTDLDESVISGRATVILDGLKRDEIFPPRQSGAWTTTAVMAEPLLAGDRCLGVLLVARDDGKRYTQRYADTLRTLATIAETPVELARLQELATLDALTGVFNRYQMEERGSAMVETALEHSQALAAVMIDLNSYGDINKTHGHPVGDHILRAVGRRLRDASRGGDIVVRYGGDEFLC